MNQRAGAAKLPKTEDPRLAQAVEHFHNGYDIHATQLVTQILSADRTHAGALNLLALLLLTQKRLDQAEQFARQAVACAPSAWHLHRTLAQILQAQGRQSDAENASQRAESLRGGNAERSRAIPDISRRQISADDAWEMAQRCLQAGKLAEAERYLQEAQKRDPTDYGIINALGSVAADLGKSAQALAYYEQAVAASPGEAAAYLNLGRLFQAQRYHDKAAECYRKALSIEPESSLGLRGMWNALRTLDRPDEACAFHEKLEAISSPSPLLRLERINLSPSLWDSRDAIDRWRANFDLAIGTMPAVDLADHMPELYYSSSYINFNIVAHGRDNLPLRKRYAALFRSSLMTYFPAPSEEAIRVGFFVGQNHEGVFLKVMGDILERWEDERMPLTVICSPLGLPVLQTYITNRLVDFLPVPDHMAKLVETVRARHFDLVYFWETGTSSANYFAPMLRLAPVQCTSWGSLESTGMRQMDYFLSSRPQEPEGAQAHYSETLALFDHIPAFYRRPPMELYEKHSRADFGLREGDRVYACAQHWWKLHPDFDAVLRGVLERDGGGILALVEDKSPALAARVKRRLSANLGTLSDRVRFVPYQTLEGYLSLLRCADVLLDTLHFGGGQTALEAFACGTPVVTLPGPYLPSRSTAACYKVMGIDTPIVSSVEEYARKAVAIATERERRDQLHARIMNSNHLLFENTATIEEHRRFFRDAVTRQREGI